MSIHPHSPEHPCRQLAARLREQIQRGEMTAQLSSITTLTVQTAWPSAPVRRAIDLLVQEHLVQTVPGPRDLRDPQLAEAECAHSGTLSPRRWGGRGNDRCRDGKTELRPWKLQS
jgi:DNA-binding transcriptional MocR family regulator